MAKSHTLVFVQLPPGGGCKLHASGMVHPGRDGADFIRQWQAVLIQKADFRLTLIHLVKNRLGKFGGAFTSGCPVIGGHRLYPQLFTDGLHQRHFFLSVVREPVDAYHRRQPELSQVKDVSLQVGSAFAQRRQVGDAQLAAGDATLHL